MADSRVTTTKFIYFNFIPFKYRHEHIFTADQVYFTNNNAVYRYQAKYIKRHDKIFYLTCKTQTIISAFYPTVFYMYIRLFKFLTRVHPIVLDFFSYFWWILDTYRCKVFSRHVDFHNINRFSSMLTLPIIRVLNDLLIILRYLKRTTRSHDIPWQFKHWGWRIICTIQCHLC